MYSNILFNSKLFENKQLLLTFYCIYQCSDLIADFQLDFKDNAYCFLTIA